MTEKEVGKVEILNEMKHIEWDIPDFLSVIDDRYYSPYISPTFSVADSLWHLRLYPHAISSPYIEMFFRTYIERKYAVEYHFGLKKRDGSVEQLVSGILKKDESCSDHAISLIKKTELLQQMSELVPRDVLTLICTLKLMTEISNSTQQTVLDQTKPLKLIRLDKLSENFKGLLYDKDTCDVTLKVKDKEYTVHRSVLMARSSVFAATFKHDTLERQTGVVTISDCDADSFQKFLEYLYTGKLEELSFPSALNLYYTSDKYDIGEVKTFCIEYLMQSLTIDNICEAVIFADKYDETQLLNAVQDFFNKNVCKILETSEWESLMKKDFRIGNKLLKENAKSKTC